MKAVNGRTTTVKRNILKNDLVPQSQYAITGRGTTACLRDTYAKWINNIDKSEHSVIASFDLKSAFASVSVDILCKKLKAIGVSSSSIKWFESFLDMRYIETIINGVRSEGIVKQN